MLRASLLFLALAASGCQTHPTSFVDAITPESISVGLTAPNLVAGPIQNSKTRLEDRRDSTGVVGVTISATYRLKPIKVERGEPQPVRIIPPAPSRAEALAHPVPTPIPDAH